MQTVPPAKPNKRGVPMPDELRERLNRQLATTTADVLAAMAGVSRGTIERAAGGLPCKPASLAQITIALGLDGEASQ